jgi:hypothetical protein
VTSLDPLHARSKILRMNSSLLRRAGISLLLACSPLLAADSGRVQLLRTPHGGIQPQAIVDAQGALHLIYFKGEAKGGDVFYVRQAPGSSEFSKPLQVNNVPGSAIAVGTIRGAHLAIGKSGRVHVAWNGSKSVSDGKYKGVPMWYARLNDAGTAFEPQRDMIQFAGTLDGGGSLAADASGNVYVMWHGSAPDNTRGEEGRALYVTRSTDEGKTFSREQRANPRDTGACACCGVRAFADSAGNLFALYRAAGEKVNRDETLIVSRDRGQSFNVINEHRWKAPTCPMSSASLVESKGGTIAAWETAEQVYFMNVDPKSLQAARPIAPPGMAKRKHPSAAANKSGDVLLAWTEGTGWQKGGSVAWQLFDASGNPTAEKGRAPGLPTWGLVAAVTKADGTFVIFY